ncbi:prenyltransferase/squalene oxidase repeat-containing protein [Tenuibacillus multivorans]|uniref:Prenyltransferase and squalene oxidase repeat-containing protein n=1 Tax=Tenuibacillus multivorans TaxID=237069 RepID=A0A1H0D1D6_9BACI|nr:prenyltransferase/squalene oxidase repeat-containing protein [Tenuibacillus multivorans]GEL76086.1 hypothetical protein TMU01_03210 [Tenuibacillus multivorans]SDN63846.1 Prenyltransferase and squalene oxidase repeat-containing protein [Tenuibacillus multivorans]
MQKLTDNALDYVMNNGTPIERWAAEKFDNPEATLPEDWSKKQNPDGGWRSKEMPSDLSNMGTTSVTLMRLIFWNLEHRDEVNNTVQYLWENQQHDGRWGEDPNQLKDSPPEWNLPNNLDVDLWETANNLASLASIGYTNDEKVLKGKNWVYKHRLPNGELPGYIHATHAMGALSFTIGDRGKFEKHMEASKKFFLENKHKDWFDVMELVWPLMLWYNAGLSTENQVVKMYLEELKARQDDDGMWKSIYPNSDTQFTIEALWLIRLYS